MDKQEIVWAIEGHALRARQLHDTGEDPYPEILRINKLSEEYLSPARQARTRNSKPRTAHRPRLEPVVPGIPYRYEIMPHVLAVLADGRTRRSDLLRDNVADRMGLTSEQRIAHRIGSKSPTPEFTNEHAWALVYLQNPRYHGGSGELILNVDPDGDPESYRITTEGRAAYDAALTFAPRTRASRRSA